MSKVRPDSSSSSPVAAASDNIAGALPADPAASAAAPVSYEAAMEELDGLVRSMESAELPLDQLLGAYQRGALLLDYCHGRLQAVEAQIKVLDEGQLKAWRPQ